MRDDRAPAHSMTAVPRRNILLNVAAAFVLICGPSKVRAVSAELLRATPRDHLAVVYFDLDADEQPGDSDAGSILHVAGSLLDRLRDGGLLSDGARSAGIAADAIASLGVVTDYPSAIVVTDARARSLGQGSFRLADLQIAVIINSNGRNGAIAAQIQALLNHWTTGGTARIVEKDEFDTTTHTLIDDRLPDWAQVKWATIADYYLISLGRGAFESCAQAIAGHARSIAADAPFAKQHSSIDGESAEIEWAFNFARIETALADVMAGKPGQVMAGLGLEGLDCAAWSIRREGRAILSSAAYRRGNALRLIRISTAVDSDADLVRVVPDEAESYAVVHYSIRRLIERARDAYLASRRPTARETIREAWHRWEQQDGARVRTDLLDQLGDRIIIHTYPPHPLGTPLLCTILFEIKGSPHRVESALDALMHQCAAWMRGGGPAPLDRHQSKWFAPRLRRSDDAIWYLQAGIYGPAVTVADKWIVLSFSPEAVRRNIARLTADTPAPQDDPH